MLTTTASSTASCSLLRPTRDGTPKMASALLLSIRATWSARRYVETGGYTVYFSQSYARFRNLFNKRPVQQFLLPLHQKWAWLPAFTSITAFRVSRQVLLSTKAWAGVCGTWAQEFCVNGWKRVFPDWRTSSIFKRLVWTLKSVVPSFKIQSISKPFITNFIFKNDFPLRGTYSNLCLIFQNIPIQINF